MMILGAKISCKILMTRIENSTELSVVISTGQPAASAAAAKCAVGWMLLVKMQHGI